MALVPAKHILNIIGKRKSRNTKSTLSAFAGMTCEVLLFIVYAKKMGSTT